MAPLVLNGMTHHNKVRTAVEQCKDEDNAIIHFGDDMRMKVVFENDVPLTADKLIREDNFLLSIDSLADEQVVLF